MKIQIFGLLHLDENQQSAMNVATKNFRDQVSIYINNAVILSNTLQLQGIEFILLTNNKEFLSDCMSSDNARTSLQISEIPFITKVPTGTKFYSAHFKLDVFRYFASLNKGYLALCDLDIVCINDYPVCLQNIIEAEIPLYYDISDQVIAAYGHDLIIRDLNKIHGLKSEGRWSGGEFISGTPEFFKILTREIDGIYSNYIDNLASLHHVGDEAITSSALEILRRNGVYIADAGTLGLIGRYWNTKTLHPQKPFSYFKRSFLLHLPADKRFLSDLARRNTTNSSEFKQLYLRHCTSSTISFKFKRSMKFLFGFLSNRWSNKEKTL